MMNGVVVRNISKDFAKVKVLENISFETEEGEFTVLLGPSGCGKSTLLNILAGLEDISNDGQIFIKDRDVTFLTPKDRDIAMVFQSYALYPNMTIRENIAFGLKNRKSNKAEIEASVERVAKILRIEDLLERKPSELSGGQRQRVAMGRAISRSPLLYLFDEPLSNLDAKLRVELRLELKLLHQNEQKSVIYVTHDQIEAMTLADKIIILNKGHIMQIGSPLDIYCSPKNIFVATFIGSPATNIFPTTIKRVNDELSFELTNAQNQTFACLLKERSLCEQLATYEGKSVLLGVRPEHLLISQGSQGNQGTASSNATSPPTSTPHDTFSFNVTVKAVEFIGSELYVYFEIDGKIIVSKCPSTIPVKQGETVTFTSEYQNVFFFDPDTEERIA